MITFIFTAFVLIYVVDSFRTPSTVEEFKEILRTFNDHEAAKHLSKELANTLVYVNVNYPNDFEPIPRLIEYYEDYVLAQKYVKILEIGPGRRPFKHATHTIDYFPAKENNGTNVLHFKLDLEHDKFPFEDNYFDFVYCRHVLQDLNYPLNAYNEMTRVAKTGFIETPSPLAETLRYNIYSEYGYRGHAQTRYMFFTDFVGNALYAIPKLPSVDFISPSIFGTPDIESVAAYILENIKHTWNNYYSWNKDQSPENRAGYNPLVVAKLGIDFSVEDLHATAAYPNIIRLALCNSIENSLTYSDQ